MLLLRHWNCIRRGVGDVDRPAGVVGASLELSGRGVGDVDRSVSVAAASLELYM